MATAHATHASVDVVRKAAIVAVLVGAVVLLHRFAVPSEDETATLLALGFVILAAHAIGELAEFVKLPHITGYLLAGLLLGPSAAEIAAGLVPDGFRLIQPFDEGILNEGVKSQLALLDSLALALIALTAGGELKVDTLRQGVRQIGAVLGGQVLVVFASVMGFAVLVSGVVPAIAFAPLGGLSTAGVVAVAALLASVSIGTSPAATVAIINSTRSRGDVSNTILSVVVLKDVVVVLLFSASLALATNTLGVGAGGGFLESLGHIALSIGFGVLLGVGIDVYLRYVGAELLLFLVAVVYTTTFVSHQIHAEPALVFIVAGFVTSNFSSLGETLIDEVERLSLPVYVVFFTLAGAKLHLEVLWGLVAFAIALVMTRIVALYAGVRLGARMVGAPAVLQRVGWMGFVSQAGMSISLANTIATTLPGELGNGLFSLILGGVAINEIIGPVMLQWTLKLAGETGAHRGETQSEDGAGDAGSEEEGDDALEPWSAPGELADPWGPPLKIAAPVATAAVVELEAELQGIVRDLARGPLEDLKDDAEDFLRSLRREFLRHHRRAVVRVQSGESLDGQVVVLRSEVGELGERWRTLVLARVARARRVQEDAAQGWSPSVIVSVVDELADALPDSEIVPVEGETLRARAADHGLKALRRAWLRTRARVVTPSREVSVRLLGRYHLAGRGPGRLEGLATLMIQGELHLAARTSALFDAFADVWDRLAQLIEQQADTERFLEALWNARREIDDEFNVAFDELEHIVQDGTNRVTLALGGLVCDLKRDLIDLGTLDLPYWRRRPSRVFRERNRGLEALDQGLRLARGTVVARYSALALELELVGLEGRVKDVVEVHGTQLARLIRGRGTTQLERVDDALRDTLARIEAMVEDPTVTAGALATALRAEAEPFGRLVADAARASTGLLNQLSDETWTTPLTQALMAAAQELTEWYTVPTGRATDGEWSLPTEVSTTEVPFREVVVGYVEASVTKDLLELTRDLEEKCASLVAVLTDLERVVAFNVELACADLDVVNPSDLLLDETRELVREMVLGAVGRSQQRLQRLVDSSTQWAEAAREGVRRAVVQELGNLRGQVLDGRITDLRLFLLREAEVRSRLVRRAGEWRGLVPQVRQRAEGLVRGALGEARIEVARAFLGLPETPVWDRPLRVAFAPPEPVIHLPVVYRRLFSDQALEAGDLLTGRKDEVHRLRAALDAQGGYRSAALVGADEIGMGALVNAVVRGVDAGALTRIEPERPVSVEEVGGWFEHVEEDGLVVVMGLAWLVQLRPGGFAPLERFVQGLIDDGGRSRWLVAVDRCVWSFLSRAVPLDTVFGAVVPLSPLGPEELAQAILSRHSMSGYAVDFQPRDDAAWPLEHLLMRGLDREQRGQAAWFRTLHSASDGVLHDALRLWMASIQEVDEQAALLRVGRVPRPPLSRIEKLPTDTLLILLQILRQGWMTPELLAGLFRTDLTHARAVLSGMAHQGLLRRDGTLERYRMVSHLRSPIERVIRARGWAP